jgi:hypothetical protein
MNTDKFKELQAARDKLAAVVQQLAEERVKELATLPSKYGFASTSEFVAAVNKATGGGSGGKPRGRKPGAAAAASGKKRRTRAVITDETRAQVKKMVAEEKTGHEIAKALGISLPSVQNIKKALGLVQKRKK